MPSLPWPQQRSHKGKSTLSHIFLTAQIPCNANIMFHHDFPNALVWSASKWTFQHKIIESVPINNTLHQSARGILPLCPVSQVRCVPGSSRIFSASRDKSALMWDLTCGDDPVQEFCGHELVVNGLAVSPGDHLMCPVCTCCSLPCLRMLSPGLISD